MPTFIDPLPLAIMMVYSKAYKALTDWELEKHSSSLRQYNLEKIFRLSKGSTSL